MTPTVPTALHAAIHAAYTAVTAHGKHLSSALEDLFRQAQPDEDTASLIRTTLTRAIRFGDLQGALQGTLGRTASNAHLHLPEWLRLRLAASLGDRLPEFLDRSAADAPVVIRVNTLRTTVEACCTELAPFHPEPLEADAVHIRRPFGLFRSEAFQRGWFEQQDATSQRVSRTLAPEPGMRVVDSCAGAGGKSLHLAALMQNRGRILSLDVVPEKLEATRKRAARAGADIIETRLIDTTKVVKRMAGTADRVLIDAPCSGTGVLRRNPDIPWHLSEGGLQELLETQRSILRLHSRLLKPGGRLVYATCSVLNEEGPEQVRAFIEEQPEFVLVETWSTLPGEQDGDGFYAAVLTRSGAS